MHEEAIFQPIIRTRVAQLGMKGTDVAHLLGMSASAWSSASRRSNLGFFILQRIALALALPVDVLCSLDVQRAVEHPVPDWPYMERLLDPDVRAEIGMDNRMERSAISWAEFVDIYRNI